MEKEALNDTENKENINEEEEIAGSDEKSSSIYEKSDSGKDVKKFKLYPKKIKRLKKNPADSGINLSSSHIKLQLEAANKMMVINRSDQKYQFFPSKNACEECAL